MAYWNWTYIFRLFKILMGFPDSSVGKESAYNARDSSSIPGSGRSAGEGIGNPLQHSWASLVAQLVKNPLAMWETCVQSLGWEDPLQEQTATHSSILAWRIPWTVQSTESQRVGHDWVTFTSLQHHAHQPLNAWENIFERQWLLHKHSAASKSGSQHCCNPGSQSRDSIQISPTVPTTSFSFLVQDPVQDHGFL